LRLTDQANNLEKKLQEYESKIQQLTLESK